MFSYPVWHVTTSASVPEGFPCPQPRGCAYTLTVTYTAHVYPPPLPESASQGGGPSGTDTIGLTQKASTRSSRYSRENTGGQSHWWKALVSLCHRSLLTAMCLRTPCGVAGKRSTLLNTGLPFDPFCRDVRVLSSRMFAALTLYDQVHLLLLAGGMQS